MILQFFCYSQQNYQIKKVQEREAACKKSRIRQSQSALHIDSPPKQTQSHQQFQYQPRAQWDDLVGRIVKREEAKLKAQELVSKKFKKQQSTKLKNYKYDSGGPKENVCKLDQSSEDNNSKFDNLDQLGEDEAKILFPQSMIPKFKGQNIPSLLL